MLQGIDRYRQARADVSPEQLVTLLFREAVTRLSKLETLDADDDAWIGDLHHVRSILLELRQALDPSADELLVTRLSELYTWCIDELLKAGKDRRAVTIEPVRKVLESLLEGWVAALSAPPDRAA
ncbi:MAG: flagellar protein FliS [Myxococcales bacterium]|nr:flagellar protein FliS [Myxococcales bacterium]